MNTLFDARLVRTRGQRFLAAQSGSVRIVGVVDQQTVAPDQVPGTTVHAEVEDTRDSPSRAHSLDDTDPVW